MKKNILFVLLSFIYIGLNATTWMVDNYPSHNAEYTSFDTVHDLASPGDTIYLNPSHFPYSNSDESRTLEIYKPLTIIGGGINPFYQASSTGTFVETFKLYAGSNGTTLSGINIMVQIRAEEPTNEIQMVNCWSRNISLEGSDWTIRNCVIRILTEYSTGANNILVSNCIISERVILSNSIISNCYLYDDGVVNNSNSSSLNCDYVDNIFAGTGSDYHNCYNCSYRHNLSDDVDNEYIEDGFGTSIFENNIYGDPQLIYTPGGVFAYDWNFTYPSTSPLAGNGFEGDDIGPLGGPYPLDEVTNTWYTTPFILEFNVNEGIQQDTIVTGMTIPISLKVIPGKQ